MITTRHPGCPLKLQIKHPVDEAVKIPRVHGPSFSAREYHLAGITPVPPPNTSWNERLHPPSSWGPGCAGADEARDDGSVGRYCDQHAAPSPHNKLLSVCRQIDLFWVAHGK